MVAVADADTELVRIVCWRQHELERAGYGSDIASLIAGCLDVDLHEAVALIRNGCKESTAVLILL